ncbi:MAG: patatin-like phospholipase family protein [Caulobacteraceae bacterium]|nr:patatin-like phospholipase family protein [Caulobacteraceae bacterium]
MCLALQGGGALGAFTWGVIDALLAGGAHVEAASGASAGAVNAALLASGLAKGGAESARETLTAFWSDVSSAGGFPAAALHLFSTLSLVPARPSPLLTNPLGLNPLRDLLHRHIDFEAVRQGPIDLFISATRVSDGAARVFRKEEISIEVLLASACLPQIQDAVEIDGELYWDGGYSANPPVMELIEDSVARELLVVELTTPAADASPVVGRQIHDRLNEFALGSSLQREISNLAFLQRVVQEDAEARSHLACRLRRLRLHRISAHDLAGADRLNPLDVSRTALTSLADLGHEAGGRWMAEQHSNGDGAADDKRRNS